jgi:murein DD-endopeptidase MepM/ murein hydrolase activator NlpD
MSFSRLRRCADSFAAYFPERHLHLRTHGESRELVLSSGRQMMIAGIIALCAVWMGVSTAASFMAALARDHEQAAVAQTQAKYERWIADRQARLNSAVAQLTASSHSTDELADSLERRHAALAMLLTEARGAPGAIQALTPVILTRGPVAASPDQRIASVRLDQERLIEATGSFAKNRADRLRLAFRLAGLDPAVYAGRGDALGGPLIDAKDPRALAAVLDIDEDFARRVQHAAADLSDARGLTAAAANLPLARPTENTQQSSGFGVRLDPFTGQPAFHSGLDFAGPAMTPVHATAPGVVSFTGQRSGYGSTIEIDHGGGFKTRYAHLAAISVTVGERVALGQRIGGMGSTGRSTGDHLHYEVWVNGRAQNPLRFVKAGDYVQQAG